VRSATTTFYINVGSIAFNPAPSTTCVGPAPLPFTVEFKDFCGNAINTSGTLQVQITGPGYNVTQSYPISGSSFSGIFSFSGATAGTYTVTATYPDLFGNTLTTTSSFTIDVAATTIAAGPAGCPTGECGTTTLSFTVNAYDACNNPIVTTSDVQIQITGPSYNQTFTISGGINNATQGTVSVSFVTSTAGTYTAVARIQNLSGIWMWIGD